MATFKPLSKEEKLKELRESLAKYEEKLKFEMKTYRGVIHESAASEIKHSTVMVYRDMVASITEEIKNLEKELELVASS
jgi:uncharacterized radical SAM superfamily protein